jgi:hypothetical protein
MSRPFTYKQKNRLLLIGLFPLALFIYSFSLKKTITVIMQVREMEERIADASEAPSKSLMLKGEINKLENRLTAYNKKSNNEQGILDFVTGYCKSNETVLREFPEMQAEEREGYIIETHRFVVQGTFSSLLSLIYLLEQKNPLGNIASVNYALKKDPKTKEQLLLATIFLQNIKQNENYKASINP